MLDDKQGVGVFKCPEREGGRNLCLTTEIVKVSHPGVVAGELGGYSKFMLTSEQLTLRLSPRLTM